MILKKILNNSGYYDLDIENNNKILKIFYAGNLDLYMMLYNKNNNNKIEEFIIDKEDYEIYSIFLNLFRSIENPNFYTNTYLSDGFYTLKELKKTRISNQKME